MYCTNCGTQNDSGNRYCKECGHLLVYNNVGHPDIPDTPEIHHQKKKSNKLGLILAISAIVAVFIIAISVISIFVFRSENKVYYGDGYSLTYNNKWSVTTVSGDKDALQFKKKREYLLPVGVSKLSDANIDFDTSSGKEELYDMFFQMWSQDGQKNSLEIFEDSNNFIYLNQDADYATYNYGTSADNIKGKYILIVSPEKNAILSFMTNADKNVDKNDERAIELLKSIEIDEQEITMTEGLNGDGTATDEIGKMLDDMSAWNRYSELRQGELGKLKKLDGEWRILSDSEVCWKFENGKFWWYKSYNDLNDNYWYGTTDIFTGKEGLSAVGLDESRLDQMIANSSGKLTGNDVYTVVCTPSKLISGGVDKTSTNISEGTTLSYVWIIVDHGSEGIEAQILDLQAYEAQYYVKVKD